MSAEDSKVAVLRHASAVEFEDAVAAAVAEASAEAVAARGQFVVAFSGGSLPGIVARGLLRFEGAVAYDKWRVVYADERVVPLDDADSNHAACRAALFDRLPRAPTVFPIDPAAADVAAEYERRLRARGLLPALDLALLGMGPDGHTCSLFPGHALLDERERLVAAIEDSPKPPPHRITLTLPALAGARRALFVLAGAAKADALRDALAGKVPAGRVRSARVDYMLDDALSAAFAAASSSSK